MTAPVIMRSLGYAGLLPFFATALGVMFLNDLLLAFSLRAFLVYSAAILCFLAGTLWGAELPAAGVGAVAPVLISNGLVLFVVFATLTAQPLVAAILLLLGYLALMWYERRALNRPKWYLRMRGWLTAGVLLSHLMFVVALSWRHAI